MRSYPGFCRSKQLEYNPGLTHRRRAGHPRANRRTSDRPSFCGARPSCSRVIMSCHIFQSTLPLWGATFCYMDFIFRSTISIHAPLVGCDQSVTESGISAQQFQSTHPLRGATAKLPKYSRQFCAKATKFLQSRTKSGVAACWAKGKRPLFPALRGANLPGKTGTLPVRIRQSARPLARNRPWHRSAQRAFHTCFQGNKSAGCPFPRP